MDPITTVVLIGAALSANSGTVALITTVLFGASEALSLIPKVKSNGVFQLVSNILRGIKGRK